MPYTSAFRRETGGVDENFYEIFDFSSLCHRVATPN
jgi:hypothetical protein